MTIENKIYITASELAEMLGVSVGHAYKIIRKLNQEIKIAVGKYQSDRLSLEIRRLREALGNICTEDDETRQILAECKSLIGQLIVLIEGNISELNSDDFRVITPDNENALAGNKDISE